MFNEIPESVDRDALIALYKKRVFERMTEKSGQILEILRAEESDILYNLISDYIKVSDAKVYILDLETYLEANVVDPDGQPVTTFGISTDPNDVTTGSVQKETYELLKAQTVIPELIGAEVAKQLEDAR